ncbi:hypothetical protein [Novosphingobium sp. JCM 18896]|uniref:hypothetical protein n=1 Tax=Novosphingobium sp. JCM 18896 TaxID=2989731 RepID=UPI00222264D4|nr:hypothetical protein [Novosphingobium sp. JCM 18896]MCW1429187.1 hypothetical protein [Novosphingobium sp. JCM 18896]
MRTALPLIALLTLAACGKSDNAPGPGGVTLGEAKALDEAAEMIEKRQYPSGSPEMPGPSTAATTVP